MNCVLIILLVSCFSLNAMNTQMVYDRDNPLFEPHEAECWEFFDQAWTFRLVAIKSVSPQEYDSENGYKNVAQHFCRIAKKNGSEYIPSPFVLSHVLLKAGKAMRDKTLKEPTDYASVRIFSIAQLTDDERKAITLEGYKIDKNLAVKVWEKSGHIMAKEFIRLGLLAPEREQKLIMEFKKRKVKEFEWALQNP